MINKFGDFRDNVFQLKEYEGNSKVLDLAEAIRRHVKPGMKLHVSDRANALARELLRQFYGSKPNFTLITTLATEQVLNLIHCGLVKKVITSSCTEIYPTPAPSRIVQRAFNRPNPSQAAAWLKKTQAPFMRCQIPSGVELK